MLVGHVKDMYKLKREPSYRQYDNNKVRYMTLSDSNYNPLRNYHTNHCTMYTFDKSLYEFHDETLSLNMARNGIVGMNAIIEIDSPDDPSSDKAKRLSFFDYINDFDHIIKHIDKKLDELTTDYNILFSGNGIYIIFEGYYENNMRDYIENFINLLANLKETETFGDKFKVHVDNAKAPWNDYMKIPFTFHETRPRISIPLPKGELDKEWIDYSSNIDNVINNYDIIDKIIKKARWRRIW